MAEQPAKTTKKIAAAAKKRPARTKAQVEQELGDAQKRVAELEAAVGESRKAALRAELRGAKDRAEADEMRERLEMVGADLLVPRGGNSGATREFVQLCLEEFPEEEIGWKPVGRCDDCDAAKRKKFGEACNRHDWIWNCAKCGNHHTSALDHISFVGHADLTNRLLELDPNWNWEPMGTKPDGTPVIDVGSSTAALWIRLTIKGVTRIGVGTAPRNKDEVLKELIGYALRNAAMRFGIALDLWAKGDRAWIDIDETGGDPDIVAVKASKEQVAQLGKAIAAVKPDGKRNALKLALAELYGKASEMRAEDIAGAVGFVQSFDWVEPTVDEAAAKLVEEFDGTEESVDKTGTPTTPADSPPEAVEDPSGGVPEEIAPETQEEADTAGSDDGRAEKLETIRVAFLSLKGKQAKAGRDALKAGDWFPLDKIPTDQLDQAAAALADAVGA